MSSFGDLVYSLFNSKTNTNGQEKSISISQGKEYKSYKEDNAKSVEWIEEKKQNIEGFSGIIGPTDVNIKNKTNETDLI